MRCLRFELQMVLFIIFSEHSLRACRLLFCQFVVVVLRQRFRLCNAAVCVLFVVFCFMLRKIIGNFSYLYNVNSYLYAASLSPLCLSLRLVPFFVLPFIWLVLLGNCHYAAKCCASSCGFLASIVPTSKSTSAATATCPAWSPSRSPSSCLSQPSALLICNLCNYFS